MEKDDVFVVTYGGTPLKVCYDLGSAVEFIQEMVDDSEHDVENYFIHKTIMQNPYLWIRKSVDESKAKVVMPNHDQALDWMVSEVGEAMAARVASQAEWVRNHPEKHTQDSVDWEIGQAIMMGILALGYTPVGIIREQLEKWGYTDIDFKPEDMSYYEMLFKFPRSEK